MIRLTRLLGVLVTIAFGLALGVGSANAQAQPKATSRTPVTFAVFNGLTALLPRIAQSQGFFAANGIDGKFVEFQTGPDLVTALLTGDVDIAQSVLAIAMPIMGRGEDILNLGWNGSVDFNLIRLGPVKDAKWPNAANPDPIRRMQDLKGKVVSVVASGGIVDQYLRALLAQAGLKPDVDVTIVATGGPATAVPALREHKVDAMTTYSSIEVLFGDAGKDYQYIVKSFPWEGSKLSPFRGRLSDTFATTRATLGKKKGAIDAACRALWQASRFAHDKANANVVIKEIQGLLNITPEQATRVYETGVGFQFGMRLTREDWARQATWAPDRLKPIFADYSKWVYEPCATDTGI